MTFSIVSEIFWHKSGVTLYRLAKIAIITNRYQISKFFAVFSRIDLLVTERPSACRADTVSLLGCVPFTAIASNLLAFSSKMADVATTSTDKRSVTFLTTYNTRSVHAVTRRAQQNLRDFTAIRPCFQQFGLRSGYAQKS